MSLYADSRAREPARRAAEGPARRQLVRALGVVVVVGALAAAVLGLASPEGAVRLVLIALVALAAFAVLVRTLEPFERLARAPRRRGTRGAVEARLPPFVERAARQLELASSAAVHFEQLRRRLCEIAEQRLAGRGLHLASEAARELLGEEAWRLLTRPLEGDKFAPGPSPAELDRLLTALQQV